MNIKDYSKKAISTLTDDYQYGDITPQMMGIILGLSGECGEVQEKFKKILRDKKGEINNKDKQELIKELGDILWYVSVAADLIGSNLEEVAKTNNEKLASRQSRQTLHGSGDNR